MPMLEPPAAATTDVEDAEIPTASLILGIGPVLPHIFAALIAWTAPHPWPTVVTWLAIWWGSVILVFMAGVRRGLTFKSPLGLRGVDLATLFWLFALGAGALAAPTPTVSLLLLIVGYASIALLEPAAARVGQAPAHFARLRPWQAGIAVVGLIGLLLNLAAGKMPL